MIQLVNANFRFIMFYTHLQAFWLRKTSFDLYRSDTIPCPEGQGMWQPRKFLFCTIAPITRIGTAMLSADCHVGRYVFLFLFMRTKRLPGSCRTMPFSCSEIKVAATLATGKPAESAIFSIDFSS